MAGEGRVTTSTVARTTAASPAASAGARIRARKTRAAQVQVAQDDRVREGSSGRRQRARVGQQRPTLSGFSVTVAQAHHQLRDPVGKVIAVVLPGVERLAVGRYQVLEVGVLRQVRNPRGDQDAGLHLVVVAAPEPLLLIRRSGGTRGSAAQVTGLPAHYPADRPDSPAQSLLPGNLVGPLRIISSVRKQEDHGQDNSAA